MTRHAQPTLPRRTKLWRAGLLRAGLSAVTCGTAVTLAHVLGTPLPVTLGVCVLGQALYEAVILPTLPPHPAA